MYCYWITAIFFTAISDFYLELLIIFYLIISSSTFLQCILIYTHTFIELHFYTLIMYFNVCIFVKCFQALLSRKRYINVSLLLLSLSLPPFLHGELRHSSMLISQLTPSNPGTHRHSYRPIMSKHRAPFRQGVLAHSTISVSQRVPAKPDRHSQVKLAMSSTQVPP